MKKTIASKDGGIDIKFSEKEANIILAAWDRSIAEQKAVQWSENRTKEYGSWEKQLDMMFWDKENGTEIWKNHIKAVKAKYPKP